MAAWNMLGKSQRLMSTKIVHTPQDQNKKIVVSALRRSLSRTHSETVSYE